MSATSSPRTGDDKPRGRKWANKNRGRCRTCSNRHVRCDGVKPTCGGCARSRRLCGWLEDAVPQSGEPLRIVLENRKYSRVFQRQPSPVSDSTDCRALAYFGGTVCPSLGGTFDSAAFSRVVCQLSQSVPAVSKAVNAISALWEVPPDSRASCSGDHRWQMIKVLGKQAEALKEANSLLRKEQSSGSAELLICSLLFICFDSIQQNFESALRQIATGLYMFLTWQNSTTTKSLQCGTSGEVIEQLKRSYSRLLVQAFMFFDEHMISEHVFDERLSPSIPPVPDSFSSIEEARDCLHMLVCTMTHQSLSMYFAGSQSKPHTSGQKNSWHFERWAASPCIRPIFTFSDDILIQYDLAFARLRKKGTLVDERQRRALASLELMRLAVQIVHGAGQQRSEMVFDLYLSQFKQIVDLASSSLVGPGLEHSPCMDIECLPSLYLAARSCRDPILRRRAIVLLRDSGKQEGVWDGKMLASLTEYMMKLEETNLTNVRSSGDVPSTSRLKIQKAVINSASRTIEASFARGQSLPGHQEVLECSIDF